MKLKLAFLIKAFIGNFIKKILGLHVYTLIAKPDVGLFAVVLEDFEVGRQLLKTEKYGWMKLNG